MFDDISSEWLNNYIKSPSSKVRLLRVGEQAKILLSQAKRDVSNPIRVLDYGSGPGIFGAYCSNFADEVLCIDTSEGMKRAFESNQRLLSKIIDNYGSCYIPERIAFKIGNEQYLSNIPRNSLQLILAIGVFEYLESPLDILEEMFECLVEKGSIIITLPNEKSIFRKYEPNLNILAIKIGTVFRMKKLKNRKYTGYNKSYCFPALGTELPKLGMRVIKTMDLPLGTDIIRRFIKPNTMYIIS
jgi:SAM-dependent methyltransferase